MNPIPQRKMIIGNRLGRVSGGYLSAGRQPRRVRRKSDILKVWISGSDDVDADSSYSEKEKRKKVSSVLFFNILPGKWRTGGGEGWGKKLKKKTRVKTL